LETEVAVFKEVSKEKFYEIRDTLEDFLRSRYWRKTFRVRSLDEDKGIKRIIRLFKEISTLIVSVGDMTVYVVPLYYFDPEIRFGYYFVSFLVIKRDPSGYTIKIKYSDSLRGSIKASSREEVEKFVDKLFGGFIRLLEKAVSTGSPNATKLAELIECLDELIECLDEIRMISFLEKIYGDEILNDDTIPGIHSVRSRKIRFFINDKVIVASDISLQVVRDVRDNKVFVYRHDINDFREVPQETKVFYDALFIGLNDLLKPEAIVIVKDRQDNIHSVSSSNVKVDGKEVSLVAIGEYDPEKKSWKHLDDIFAITCDNRCSIYPFWEKHVIYDIDEIDKNIYLKRVKEVLIRYILMNKEIERRAREWMVKELTKKYEWEILPA
jgi:hypothetical protein